MAPPLRVYLSRVGIDIIVTRPLLLEFQIERVESRWPMERTNKRHHPSDMENQRFPPRSKVIRFSPRPCANHLFLHSPSTLPFFYRSRNLRTPPGYFACIRSHPWWSSHPVHSFDISRFVASEIFSSLSNKSVLICGQLKIDYFYRILKYTNCKIKFKSLRKEKIFIH